MIGELLELLFKFWFYAFVVMFLLVGLIIITPFVLIGAKKTGKSPGREWLRLLNAIGNIPFKKHHRHRRHHH